LTANGHRCTNTREALDGHPSEKTRVLAKHRNPPPSARNLGGWPDDDFIRELAKFLRPGAQFIPRLRISTLLGEVALDLHLRIREFTVGFVYQSNWEPGFAGLWCDAALVGSGAVEIVYRIRPCDVEAHLDDALYAVARSDSHLFSERGHINLGRLAHDAMKTHRFPQEFVEIRYPAIDFEEMGCDPSGDPEDTSPVSNLADGSDRLFMIRRDQPRLARWYRYLRRSGARTVDQIMHRFKQEHLGAVDEPDSE
jgi:hypothetical protein